MKKLLYIGAMSTLLLTACGEEKAGETSNAQEEIDKAKEKEAEQAKEDAELKAQDEQEAKEETEVIAEKLITINEAKEIIENSGMGEEDKLVSLNVENGEIKAVIDLAPNKFNLPPKDIAVSSYQMASDELLAVEGQ